MTTATTPCSRRSRSAVGGGDFDGGDGNDTASFYYSRDGVGDLATGAGSNTGDAAELVAYTFNAVETSSAPTTTTP